MFRMPPSLSTASLPPTSLSVAIACKNEIRCIRRVLESVAPLVNRHLAPGEIVAVDSGSTDGTLDVLREFNCRIIQTHWRGFVNTVQFTLEQCRGPWVLCLDGDEPLDPQLAASIARVLDDNDPTIVGARMNRIVYYNGQPLRHVWQPERRLRLVRNGRARWTGAEPHYKLDIMPSPEHDAAALRILDLPGHIRHESIADFATFLRKQAGLARLSAHALHAQGNRGSLLQLITSPAGAFLKQLLLKRGFQDGWPGWLAAASQAAGTLMKHAILIELSNRPELASPPSPSADPFAATPDPRR
jgi:glycosyltransferase involved in cell wall biosynthesis